MRLTQRLFSNLFAYRPRVGDAIKRDRSPIEDWLTECLAACIRALLEGSPERVARVLAQFTNESDETILDALSHFGLEVETQSHAGRDGRPDMVFWMGDWPWIVVENKVNHVAKIDQLLGYSKWQSGTELSEKGKAIRENSKLQPSILFISHNTPVPAGFSNSNPAFAQVYTHSTRWSRFSKALCEATEDLSADSHQKSLARSFHEFLEEQHMATEYPTTRAISAAEIFMEDGAQLSDLANDMLAEGLCIGDFAKQPTYYAGPNYTQGLLYATRWANRVIGEIGATLGTGFWFPQIGTFGAEIRQNLPGMAITDAVKVFITIENEQLMERCQGNPDGWHRDEDEFLIFADFSSFEGSPDERGRGILDWTKRSCKNFCEWARKQT